MDAIKRHPWRSLVIGLFLLYVLVYLTAVLLSVFGQGAGDVGYGPMPG